MIWWPMRNIKQKRSSDLQWACFGFLSRLFGFRRILGFRRKVFWFPNKPWFPKNPFWLPNNFVTFGHFIFQLCFFFWGFLCHLVWTQHHFPLPCPHRLHDSHLEFDTLVCWLDDMSGSEDTLVCTCLSISVWHASFFGKQLQRCNQNVHDSHSPQQCSSVSVRSHYQ